MQIENLRGFFSLSLNEQATKEKKQKKVAKKIFSQQIIEKNK